MSVFPLTGKRKKIAKINVACIACIACLTIVSSIYRSVQLESIYDLPENEVVYHLDQYSTSSKENSTDHTLSSTFWWLSGACPIGSLQLPQAQVCTVSARQSIGAIKLFFFPQEGTPVVWAPTDDPSLPLAAGSYEVYGIGKHFFGSVEIALPPQSQP